MCFRKLSGGTDRWYFVSHYWYYVNRFISSILSRNCPLISYYFIHVSDPISEATYSVPYLGFTSHPSSYQLCETLPVQKRGIVRVAGLASQTMHVQYTYY